MTSTRHDGRPRALRLKRLIPLLGKLLTCLLCSAAWAQAQIPTINSNGLVNGATGRSNSSVPVAARGSLVTIFGSNLASTTLTANGVPVPKQLGSTQVFFGNIPAPLLYVSPSEIKAQVPFELPDVVSVDLVIQNGNGNSGPDGHVTGAGPRDFRNGQVRSFG